jgi:two-component system, OmpR family, sensor histidine kinase VicK
MARARATERRTPSQRRQHAAAILACAVDAIVCLDLEARITYANAAATRLLDCSDADDLLGQPIGTLLQIGAIGGAGGTLRFGNLDLQPSGDLLCWRDNGSSFPVEYEAAPLIEDGRVIGAVVTLRDISRRRAAEQLKDELVGIVSHELRSPLTSLRSALGLLASGRMAVLPDNAQRMLDVAVANTDRLIRLVNDLLDLERLDKGQIPMTRQMCSAGELMTQAANFMLALAEQYGITIKAEPSDSTLFGDPDRLLQVLINLLSNAVKFSPVGGTVWLDAAEESGELILRVRDQGRGIPNDKLESIFNRFAQVDASDGRDNKGTGLGLAIARGIVKQHGGHIWAESSSGAGTTFFVALPADQHAARGDNSLRAA